MIGFDTSNERYRYKFRTQGINFLSVYRTEQINTAPMILRIKSNSILPWEYHIRLGFTIDKENSKSSNIFF